MSIFNQIKDYIFGYSRQQLLKLIYDKNTELSQQQAVIKSLLKRNENLQHKIDEVRGLLLRYTETMNHHDRMKPNE